ncbi:OmpA/MotB family protein [Magnetospirillum sulfuroxidans]|uniref:Flagellar motor protein MotB n=1 Tax=Magnetospirillum sulfuroxidans TaxID=611300 RepID=A0ABS5I7N0_9PROT|nr:flagellar motor protein MotB [Magnetospirillum sulfuroxidans]MBR9970439.1 flagellar motor protein MotB [Magnetospirillum sulfuroxidans]
MSLFQNKRSNEVDASWMETYGDMVTLLLCFFIMLASISKIDTVLFEKVQSGMTKEIGKQPPQRPIESMRKELADVVTAFQGGDEAADVGTDERGVVLNLDSGAMFAPGSADIKPGMVPLMKELVGTLAQPRFENYRLEIQGHTDNVPVKTATFASNFDLSSARALATMRALVSLGLSESKMIVAAYGQFSPRVPNTLEDGTPLPANQALNRRVAIHVYPR